MPSEDTKIFEFNQYQKSDKAQFIECIIDEERWTLKEPENFIYNKSKPTYSIRLFNVYNIFT